MNNLEPKSYKMRCSCGVIFRVNLIESLASEFPPDPSNEGGLLGMCSKCSDSEDAAAGDKEAIAKQQKQAEQRRNAWENGCPFEYRTKEEGGETDPALLNNVRLIIATDAGHQQVPWQHLLKLTGRTPQELDRPVVILTGPSGSSKTRIAWRMARAAFDAQRVVSYDTSLTFQHRFQDAAGRFQAGPLMGSLVATPFVGIDDLGKVEWTDNTSAAFFELLEQRIARRLLTVITTELMGGQLENWFSGARSSVLANAASAIMRRLRQRGQVILCSQQGA